jgi:hypothetical protein
LIYYVYTFFQQELIMGKFTVRASLKLVVSFMAFSALTGGAFAEATTGITDSSASAVASHSRVLVFGKFRLVKNEYESRLGPGFFGNTAAFTLFRVDDQEEMTVRVGKDGRFSRKLSPGDYHLMEIEFKHQGETIRTDTNYMIHVSGATESNYIGTLTLTAKFDRGYMGVDGVIESFSIADNCENECDSILSELGVSGKSMMTSLPVWQAHFANSQ